MDAHSKYLIPIGVKLLDVLELFRTPADELTLDEVRQRTGIAHTTVYRILYTLSHRGYLIQSGKHYRLSAARRKLRIAYATLSPQSPFAEAVRLSLESAASQAGIDLVAYDNERSAAKAIANARDMARRKVDLAIEFQRHEEAAPVIADILADARIPAIAIHIPQPGATYFGVDNFRVGYTAGAELAEYAKRAWKGRFDLLLLLDVPQGGMVLQARMTGVMKAIEDACGPVPKPKVVRTGGGAIRAEAQRLTAGVLNERMSARRVLISATSDDGALGALDAVKEAGAAVEAAVVGMEGTREALAEMTPGASPMIATIDFFPETYGPALIEVALKLLRGDPVAPFHYVPHELVRARRSSTKNRRQAGAHSERQL